MNHAAALKTRIESIEVGSRVLVYNPAFRRDQWHTVKEVVSAGELSTARVITTTGKTLWATDIKVVHTSDKTETLMICLNQREPELLEAVKRAEVSSLEVFPDFEFDSYIVVNRANRHEYKVDLKTVAGKVLASCDCEDFKRRGRICKHQAIVLRQCEIGLLARSSRQERLSVAA
jgi:hypothetical protein